MPNSRHMSVIASPSSRRATKRRRSSITELSFHGIHTSRPKAKSVTHVSGTKCHPCLRPHIFPMDWVFGWMCWRTTVDTMESMPRGRCGGLKLLGAGVDHGPQFGAVLDLLHLGREAALSFDPFLHWRRIGGQQVGGPGVARQLDAKGVALVEIGLMEAQARIGRHTDSAERDDAEHERAGGIADAVDDHALAALANFCIFGLVALDQPAVVTRDAIIRTRGRAQREQNRHDIAHDSPSPLNPIVAQRLTAATWHKFGRARFDLR